MMTSVARQVHSRSFNESHWRPFCVCRLVEELWQAFLAYLGGGKEQDKATLNDKLKQVSQVLESTRGPFLGADYVCAADVRLAPRLRHILVALPGLQVCS